MKPIRRRLVGAGLIKSLLPQGGKVFTAFSERFVNAHPLASHGVCNGSLRSNGLLCHDRLSHCHQRLQRQNDRRRSVLSIPYEVHGFEGSTSHNFNSSLMMSHKCL
jgi:hypothetical protein